MVAPRVSKGTGKLPPAEQPKQERQDDTDQQTSHQRKIERRIFTTNHNVPGEPAKTDGQLFAERENHSQRENDNSKRDQRAADAHTSIVNYPREVCAGAAWPRQIG